MQFQLIPVAKAQSLDATAQPTFGPISLSGGGSGDQTVQVILSNSASKVAVGSKFTVTVELKTGSEISASEYQIVLSYDPQALTVIDQDTTTSGTQPKLVDTLFTIPQPIQDNSYTTATSGLIFLKAKGDFPVTINRKIIEIQFQAQKQGATEIKVDTTPIQGTRIRRGNTDIAYTPSNLTVAVGDTSSGATCTVNNDCPSGQICQNNLCITGNNNSCTTTTDCSSGQVCQNGSCVAITGGGGNLPSTALFDSVGLPFTIVAFAFIAIGLYLHRAKETRA